MKKVAIIGSQGVPSNYGGFESLVENIIGRNASEDVSYTIFCSGNSYREHIPQYKGAFLKYIPLRANGIQSVLYDISSMILCIGKDFDDILILGVSGCVFLPLFKLFYHKKIIVNIDGLEHKRAKWGRFAKIFLRSSEYFAVKFADGVVADNRGIQEYITQRYGKESTLITYGGDHAIRCVDDEFRLSVLSSFGLASGKYAISVCRIEPENNSAMILEAFSKSDKMLVFVGNWDKSEYGRMLKRKYAGLSNILMLSPIYDLDILYVLRSNAFLYIHGHSAGGTNPSLVEAMFYGIPVVAFDVIYNRYTTANSALYFNCVEKLQGIIDDVTKYESLGRVMESIAKKEYVWKEIARKYEALY